MAFTLAAILASPDHETVRAELENPRPLAPDMVVVPYASAAEADATRSQAPKTVYETTIGGETIRLRAHPLELTERARAPVPRLPPGFWHNHARPCGVPGCEGGVQLGGVTLMGSR